MNNEIQKFCPSCRKHRTFKHSFNISFATSGKPFEYVYKCSICDYKIYQPATDAQPTQTTG